MLMTAARHRSAYRSLNIVWNQLFLSYPSFEQALFILQWEADDRIAGIGTDE